MFACSCAGTVRETPRAAAPAALEGTLASAHEPGHRQQVADILADPQIGTAAAKLTESITSGVVRGLADGENWNSLRDQSREFAIQLGTDLTQSVARGLRPEIVAIVEHSVDRAMSRILSQESEARAAAFAAAITRAVMQGMGQELASMDLANPSTSQGASAIARQIAHGAALGAQDAVRETKQRNQRGNEQEGDILADAEQALDRGASLLSASILVPIGFALAATAGLVWALYRARRYRRASEANRDAMGLVVQAVQAEPDNPAMQALRERLGDLSGGRLGVDVPGGSKREAGEQTQAYSPRQH